jgi:hypothetical protein
MSLVGEVLGYFRRDGVGLGQLGWVHGLAYPNENGLYISELLIWHVQKFTLLPLDQPAHPKPELQGECVASPPAHQ